MTVDDSRSYLAHLITSSKTMVSTRTKVRGKTSLLEKPCLVLAVQSIARKSIDEHSCLHDNLNSVT